ncbi:carbon storage regulator CsrA [uncultured Pseudokineococcus sp.]|uniref:carbon storage regulator CsrA n=1 Tax=uncultured Pseudokineococcus sp. TaxID=1642928 RepID=UPI00260A0DE9|nr:carbon storage regulator CsrA [uncultured Pseudokineococcus sp.]
MLVLTRRAGESIVIGDDVVVTVVEVRGEVVRLGVDAPRSVQVHREEVYRAVVEANRSAAAVSDDAIAALTSGLRGAPGSAGAQAGTDTAPSGAAADDGATDR